MTFWWYYVILHNATHINEKNDNWPNNATQNTFYCYPNFRYAEYHYTECHFTECHFTDCHNAERHYKLNVGAPLGRLE
jgi:hypothetical protein